MKVKAIIVDKLPKNCEECAFGHKRLTVDDEPCDLVGNIAISNNFCPLVVAEDYSALKDY